MFITRCRPISEPAPQGYISKTRKHRKSPVRWRGGGFENAIERSIAYVKEGGVDAIWVNTLRKREEIGESCRRIPGPVIAPYYGPQPSPTFDEFQKLGAAAVLYPSLTTAAGVQATWEVLNEFKERGPVVLEEWNNKGLASKYAPSRATKIRSCHQRRSPSWKKDSSPKNCNEIIRTPLVTSGTGRSKSEAEGGIQVKDGDQRGYELGFGAFIRAGQAAGL